MYGRTVNARTFMERSANHSTKGSRRGFVDVETGTNPSSLLTPAQQRDNLKRKHAALGDERQRIKHERRGKDRYEQIGREMQDVQAQLSALNAKIVPGRSGTAFDYYFNLCAKTLLGTSDYERIAEAARRRQVEENSND